MRQLRRTGIEADLNLALAGWRDILTVTPV